MEELVQKTCSKCKNLKNVKDFNKRKKGKGGLCERCKCCDKEYRSKYYLKNKDKIDKRKKMKKDPSYCVSNMIKKVGV